MQGAPGPIGIDDESEINDYDNRCRRAAHEPVRVPFTGHRIAD